MDLSCAPLDSPIGQLWVTVSSVGLVEVRRGSLPRDDATVDPGAVGEALAEIDAYFAGRLRDFSLPMDLTDASPFDSAVWRATRHIGYGSTASYGELAMMAGHPGAARAVGGSMARCPFFPVVPCHRVIHADGSIGGWGEDTSVKRWLLDFERGIGER